MRQLRCIAYSSPLGYHGPSRSMTTRCKLDRAASPHVTPTMIQDFICHGSSIRSRVTSLEQNGENPTTPCHGINAANVQDSVHHVSLLSHTFWSARAPPVPAHRVSDFSTCCVENEQNLSLMATTSYVPSWLALTILLCSYEMSCLVSSTTLRCPFLALLLLV